jgi:hypothetical protein
VSSASAAPTTASASVPDRGAGARRRGWLRPQGLRAEHVQEALDARLCRVEPDQDTPRDGGRRRADHARAGLEILRQPLEIGLTRQPHAQPAGQGMLDDEATG